MPDHALYFFLICSEFSHSFPDSTGFLLFLDLASEAQEAQAARLFLFSCREALFSPAFLTCSFLFSFVVPLPDLSSHAIWRTVYLTSAYFYHCTFPILSLYFWRTHRSQSTKNNLFRRKTNNQPSGKEWSTPTWKRRRRHRCVLRVRSIPFLFWAGIYFSSSSPFLHNTHQLTLFSLLVLNNRWTRRQR